MTFTKEQLPHINSLTKYPPIETYHKLDPTNGNLLEEPMKFDGKVIVTEKVDGTNARVIVFENGDFIIGSREELLYAKGDRVVNPTLGIVEAVLPTAEALADKAFRIDVAFPPTVFYFEAFGGGIGSNWKQYTKQKTLTGVRLFDVAEFPEYTEQVSWPREKIASWRERGGQRFVDSTSLQGISSLFGLELVPTLFHMDPALLPVSVEGMLKFMKEQVEAGGSACTLSDDAGAGKVEGMVLRTLDRKTIAKARLEDYGRTLRRRGQL